jgi:predicted metal-dependent phosphoesterase TrpH
MNDAIETRKTIKLDFHVHTNHSSDSIIKPAELAKKSRQLGILPTIADHNSISAWKDMKAADAEFIPAEEIRTTAGDLIGLFINELIPKGLSFPETVDRIKQQGGLAYLPHMYDQTRQGSGDKYAKLVDIIETFNGRCIGNMNKRAEETAKKFKKPGAAGSDSHFLFEFGSTYTELPDLDSDISSPSALLKAFKSKKAVLIKKTAPVYVRGITFLLSKTRKFRKKLSGQ